MEVIAKIDGSHQLMKLSMPINKPAMGAAFYYDGYASTMVKESNCARLSIFMSGMLKVIVASVDLDTVVTHIPQSTF